MGTDLNGFLLSFMAYFFSGSDEIGPWLRDKWLSREILAAKLLLVRYVLGRLAVGDVWLCGKINTF